MAYARAQVEDLVAPETISDAAFKAYVIAAEMDFARFVKRGNLYVGNFGALPPTSPLSTQTGISRYEASVANGFDPAIIDVVDVLFTATGEFNAANEMAWLSFAPTSVMAWRSFEGGIFSSPSSRVIRDSYLNEIAHLSRGRWKYNSDESGIPSIDVYPVPTIAGLPIFVAYNARHTATLIPNDPDDSVTYPTIPEVKCLWFAELLCAKTLDELAIRIAGKKMTKAGMNQKMTDPGVFRSLARDRRDAAYNALGINTTIISVSG